MKRQPQQAPPGQHIYHYQRLLLAICVVLGPAAVLIAVFTNPPYYGSQSGIGSAVATNASDSDLIDLTHLVTLLIAAYVLPFSFLVMAWLANRRSPWLATIGAILAMLGFLPLALNVGQDSLYYDIARWGSSAQFVELAQRWNSDGIMTWYGISFGLGSVFGPTLIGIALWRSRVIPTWAAIFLTFSRLPVFVFLFVPYHLATAIVLAGTVLLLIGSIPAARAAVKTLPAKEPPSPA